jgi:hypothetical protein
VVKESFEKAFEVFSLDRIAHHVHEDDHVFALVE